MNEKEYYYTAELISLDAYTEHVRQYLAGERTVPVCRVTSTHHEHVTFTFAHDLHRLLIESPGKLKKPFECALKYGFRGYSKGGKNGIFYLRKQDTGLHRAVEDYLSQASIQQEAERALLLDVYQGLLPDLPPVKIVYHQPSGERVVGILNEDTRRIIFLGFASY